MSNYSSLPLDTILFTDGPAYTVNHIYTLSVTDNLPISQGTFTYTIPYPWGFTITDNVTTSDIITDERFIAPISDNNIEIIDSISVAFGYLRSVTDTFAISEHIIPQYLPGGVLNYNTINSVNTLPITTTTSGITTVSQVPITQYVGGLTTPSAITLTYDDTTVTLRKPDFGDTDDYEVFRIQRNNRGGDLQIYQDPMWPTTEILDLKFSELDDPTDLISFLTSAQGYQITLKDHYGQTWLGVILTPAGQVVQPKRYTYTATFRFQGVLQS